MSQKERNKIEIRTTLKGKTANKFSEIKDHLGLENDTEVVRAMISEYHRNNIKKAWTLTDTYRVRIRKDTFEFIEKSRGLKRFKNYVHDAITTFQKVKRENSQLTAELKKLREQLSSESQPIQKVDVDCPALLQLPEGLFCCKNAPKIVPLATIEICKAHLKFYKIKEQLTQDYFYTTCGAEQVIAQDGQQWMKCPLDFNRLHRWSDCQKAKCKHVKPLKVEKGGR